MSCWPNKLMWFSTSVPFGGRRLGRVISVSVGWQRQTPYMWLAGLDSCVFFYGFWVFHFQKHGFMRFILKEVFKKLFKCTSLNTMYSFWQDACPWHLKKKFNNNTHCCEIQPPRTQPFLSPYLSSHSINLHLRWFIYNLLITVFISERDEGP